MHDREFQRLCWIGIAKSAMDSLENRCALVIWLGHSKLECTYNHKHFSFMNKWTHSALCVFAIDIENVWHRMTKRVSERERHTHWQIPNATSRRIYGIQSYVWSCSHGSLNLVQLLQFGILSYFIEIMLNNLHYIWSWWNISKKSRDFWNVLQLETLLVSIFSIWTWLVVGIESVVNNKYSS